MATSNINSAAFASALSTVCNDSSPRASVASCSKTKIKTSCLFCPSVVILGKRTNPNVHNAELYKLVINLCNHLQLNTAEIPSQRCTATRFPFCSRCEALVVLLYKQQLIYEQIALKIEQTAREIELAVADGEIMMRGQQPGSSSMAQTEGQKFTQLREMILAGYRDQLSRRQEQNNAETEFMNGNEKEENDEEIEAASSAADAEHQRFEQMDERFNTSADSIQFGSTIEEEDDNSPPFPIHQDVADPDDQHHPYSDTSMTENDGNDGWSEDDIFNGTNATVIITNENAETDETTLIQIKEETYVFARDQNDDGERNLSLAAIERRSIDNMVSTKATASYRTGRGRSEPKRRNRKKGNAKRQRASALDPPSNSNSSHNCTFCSRTFGRKCHLMNHMKSHAQFQKQNKE